MTDSANAEGAASGEFALESGEPVGGDGGEGEGAQAGVEVLLGAADVVSEGALGVLDLAPEPKEVCPGLARVDVDDGTTANGIGLDLLCTQFLCGSAVGVVGRPVPAPIGADPVYLPTITVLSGFGYFWHCSDLNVAGMCQSTFAAQYRSLITQLQTGAPGWTRTNDPRLRSPTLLIPQPLAAVRT